MSQVTLDDIKRHVNAVEFSVDDPLLGDLQAVAEEFVQSYTRRNLDEELPGAWPLACTMAVKMLVALWYDNKRDGVTEGPATEIPFGIRDLLAPHKDHS
ncbi:hypothetical protein P775_14230 [Puniceibacterium antarcticum]|uniref:Phage gp6-like head-tail connector protein n=1 Tax=Puniceibacterium antarcticum TaxID=1206336 RepID=A0A2G8RD86_9RHOB|nr:head-tail connector protein [Puniceibacterium antarcticum]PIL19507.1 hypothetical protein P775_14230 [Puniceibacterium antarcticum]